MPGHEACLVVLVFMRALTSRARDQLGRVLGRLAFLPEGADVHMEMIRARLASSLLQQGMVHV